MSALGSLVGIKLKGHNRWLCVFTRGDEWLGGSGLSWGWMEPGSRAPTAFHSVERAVAYAQEFDIALGSYEVLPVP